MSERASLQSLLDKVAIANTKQTYQLLSGADLTQPA